jgi:hypothetical protein
VGDVAERPGVDEVDVVLVRTDPPVDADYLALTLLLEFARGTTLLVNDPRGSARLREANEKPYACRFPELMPTTVVTADRATLLRSNSQGARIDRRVATLRCGVVTRIADHREPVNEYLTRIVDFSMLSIPLGNVGYR